MTLVTDPLQVLDNMRSIVEREMLTHGQYITSFVVDEELASQGAICGGHRACAVGSLWLAAGVKPNKDKWGEHTLPGVAADYRRDFLADKPTLRLVYDTLNEVAQDYITSHNLHISFAWAHAGALESLFEGGSHRHTYDADEPAIDKSIMLELIDAAKRRIAPA